MSMRLKKIKWNHFINYMVVGAALIVFIVLSNTTNMA